MACHRKPCRYCRVAAKARHSGSGSLRNIPIRRGVTRRSMMAGLAATVCSTALAPNARAQHLAARSFAAEWATFKRRFLAPDGRVIDTGNGGCSHSEGQGWGLVFAVAADDQEAFDLILRWTATHLRRPDDRLHAWRWQPDEANPVTDMNNATDGDIYIASAMWRASVRWQRPDQARAAAGVARDVLRLLLREVGHRTLLLPGAEGYESEAGVAVNLSYYAFPMLADLAAAAPSPLWNELCRDGLALIEEARFGEWRLPPDWLHVSRADGTLQPHPHWPPRFSYDAIRVPLYLAWAQDAASLVQQSFTSYWEGSQQRRAAAWVDLVTNAYADYAAPAGMQAVAKLATLAHAAPQMRFCNKFDASVTFPVIEGTSDYYSAALILLSRLAWQERCAR